MPAYTFRDKETGEESTHVMTYAERCDYLSKNENLEHIIVSAPKLCDPLHVGAIRLDNEFRDVLKGIKKGSPGSTIDA